MKNLRCSGVPLSHAATRVGQTRVCATGEPTGIISRVSLKCSTIVVSGGVLGPAMARVVYILHAWLLRSKSIEIEFECSGSLA